MNPIQSTTQRFARRTFGMLVVMSVALAPLGFAEGQSGTSSATATVATVNALSVTAGNSLTLTPTVGAADVDATTALAFETNDGVTYKVTVVAAVGGWVFTPAVGTTAANTYPELRFVSATATAGTPSTTAGVLISTANVVGPAANVVTAITSASGTAAVTLDASITQTVVAGSYAATLTYALVLP